MTSAIILMFLGLVAANPSPDPVTLFEKLDVLDMASTGQRSGMSEIENVLTDQGVALAEATFDSTFSKNKCMAYELCKFGADDETEFKPAFMAFQAFLQSMKNTTERSTQNIDNLLAAVEVGKALGEKSCSSIYQCTVPKNTNKGRLPCQVLGHICPGLAMSCALCGIYAPIVCGPSCTFAGLYCGVAGYSC